MRKRQKKEILDFINSLYQAHDEIKSELEKKNLILVQNMISECQKFAISLGENIEKLEGKGQITVSYIEEYCEILFHIYNDITSANINEKKIYKVLRKQLIKIENSVRNDITVRKEIAFFPYKASMWDSMESIYLAAKDDPDCDAYCVAVPYYDLKPDRSFGQMHYEGYDYPEDITVIDWEKYNFEERKPDVIYSHYAYDDWNLVTSIHPRYYSSNLKKYTDCLVYCPYYSTAGGMSEGQKTCPVYFNADYIIIQSSKFRDYFDERIPDKKFLPFGSPKFDKIIKKCQNPPEPPKKWREKMTGQNGERKKVYFYNTSIGGMLNDTEAFLKKMRYVFDTFKGRKDTCILWRPHPLLESTFDSMRPQYRPVYEGLKKYYMENDIGIYDDTPDMTDAISWSDAYIGDAGTSVTSLFGIVGKPLFILNNQLWSLPSEDSWRGEIIPGTMFNYFERDRFAITQGNKLFISEPYKYDYKYFCDLSEYSYGGYYSTVREVNGKWYVCPANAQDLLVLDKNGVEKRIRLKDKLGNRGGAFYGVWVWDKYLLLLPKQYPALVRYDTETEEIKYLGDNIDVFVKKNKRNEKIGGGSWVFEGILYIASPTDNHIYKLEIESGKSEIIELPHNSQGGCISMVERNGCMWMLPYRGQTILRWNLRTEKIKQYTGFPENFQCIHPVYKTITDEYPVSLAAIIENIIYFIPNWGNMGIKLDTETGIFSKWNLPIPLKEGKEYFFTGGKYAVIWNLENEDKYKLFYYPERKLYDYDIEKNECREVEVRFDLKKLRVHENGFNDDSQWLKYCCCENAFNSLKDFLDGNITGRQYDREKQIKSYKEIVANNDGSCGQKVHEFVMSL